LYTHGSLYTHSQMLLDPCMWDLSYMHGFTLNVSLLKNNIFIWNWVKPRGTRPFIHERWTTHFSVNIGGTYSLIHISYSTVCNGAALHHFVMDFPWTQGSNRPTKDKQFGDPGTVKRLLRGVLPPPINDIDIGSHLGFRNRKIN